MIESAVVDCADSLASLREPWEQLLRRSHNNEPTLSPEWLLAWWSTFGGDGGRQLRVLTVRDGGELVGLVPLLARRYRYRIGVAFRRLELLASGEAEADEIMSEYLGPIAARGFEGRVAEQTARALIDGRLGPWDELVCPRMSAASPMTTELGDALSAAGLVTTLTDNGVCHHVALPGTWEAYLAALPSRHRYAVKRSLRELESYTQGDWYLRTVAGTDELPEGFDILSTLHAERWRPQGHKGAFASERFSSFHRRVMPHLLERGSLQLAWLVARDQPVAAAYNLLWNDTVYFYQSGRAVTLPGKLRAGFALHALLIHRAIEDGRACYDFLAGDAQYKRQLSTNSRRLVELRAHRKRSIRDLARRLGERGLEGARRVRRKIGDRRT